MQIDRISGEKISFLLSPRGSLSFQNKLKSKLKELFLKYAPLDLKESDNVIDYKADIACSIFFTKRFATGTTGGGIACSQGGKRCLS